MKRKEYEKAVEGYKEALRNNPTDEETRYNLALAKELLKKEQDEQKDDKNEDNKDNKEDKTEEDKDKNARVKTSAKSSPCPYQQIVNLYHEKLPMLPKVVTLSDARKRSLKARWANGASNMKFWEDYFDSVSESKFMTGRVDPTPGRKQFVADIDFLIRESTIIKTQEGKYHG